MGPTEFLNVTEGWENYWAEEGSVYQLSFLTPPASECKNDKAAYDQLVRPEGIVQMSLATRLGTDAPRGGHERITDRVWSAWVIIVKAGRLGHLVQSVLKPCGNAQYKLAVVNRMRTGTNAVALTFAKSNDQVEKFAQGAGLPTFSDGVKTGKDISAKAGDVVTETFDRTVDVVGTIVKAIAVPVIAGVVVYALVQRREG